MKIPGTSIKISRGHRPSWRKLNYVHAGMWILLSLFIVPLGWQHAPRGDWGAILTIVGYPIITGMTVYLAIQEFRRGRAIRRRAIRRRAI